MTVPIIERLAERRATVGLTQADVAGRMGTSQSVIARLEAGGRDPRISTLERYAEAVGAGLEVRVPVGPLPMSAARLAERIGGRLARGSEPSTATFREVIQFIDDVQGLSDDETRAMLRPVPPSTGDRRWDAMVAAAAEWVAGLHGIPAPRWTKSPSRKVAAPGWVITPHVRLHDLVRANTPGEFARHGVYIDRDSLASV